jgi:hypothetical protein
MKAIVNGIETYYEVHGREGAPWLVLSHSLACTVFNRALAEFLSSPASG